MNRKQINIGIVKALLAKSGNKCAFQNCNHPIFNDQNLFVSNLCHIEAFSPNGPRYNKKKELSYINSYENLIFLCYRHHKEIDSDKSYTVRKIKSIKAKHEANYSESILKFDKYAIAQILSETKSFWNDFNSEILLNHEMPGANFKISHTATFLELYKQAHSLLDEFETILGKINKKFLKAHSEVFFVEHANFLMNIHLLLDHMCIKYYEETLKSNPLNKNLLNRLRKARKDYLSLSKIAHKYSN